MTIFYIDPQGDDENDGMTRATAWKTLPFGFTPLNLLRYPRKTWRDRHRNRKVKRDDFVCFASGVHRETLSIQTDRLYRFDE